MMEPNYLANRARGRSDEGATKPLQNRRILLVEDCPDSQRLLSLTLQKAGAEVTLECNGSAALDNVARAARVGAPFDLILMDLQMPVMDGLEATVRLRTQGNRIPVIAVTADRERQQLCLDSGFDDFLTKPIGPGVLVEAIRGQLVKSPARVS